VPHFLANLPLRLQRRWQRQRAHSRKLSQILPLWIHRTPTTCCS
jgi:hypothetical protein